MKRVLFVASAVSYFREMAPAVWHFRDRGWDVHVLLGSVSPLSDMVVADCAGRGIPASISPADISYGGEAAESPTSGVSTASPPPVPLMESPGAGLPDWLRGAIRWTRLGRFLRIPGDMMRMRRIRKFSDGYISALRPDAVFQGAYHSVGQIDNGIARACASQGIPRYCLPNSDYLGGRILQVARRSHLHTGMATDGILAEFDWINRLFARLFPRWTEKISDGRRSFYWDPVFILSAWLSGLFFERLWMKPALDFRRVFALSKYSADTLRSEGYPMAKVVVAGQPLLDSVWERSADRAQQETLHRYLAIAPGTPFLLVNIEPSAEHSYSTWEKHWDNFNVVMDAVTAHGMPVVLSLHPLCDGPRYEFAVQKYGVFICKDYKIHDLYPFCGISISFPCSTNLLAPVFNKPLIIFDFHGLTTADEDSAFVHALPGAKLAYSGAELSLKIAETMQESRAGGVAPRPARLASETIFDTVAADLGDGPEHAPMAAPLVMRRAS